jgi:uncharacterized 2Fe-2S/4Fe-4S cluster protein (DUF4445 family)
VKLYKIHFEPLDRCGECPSDRSLLQAAQDLEIDLVSLCGGLGTCHRCKLQVLTGLVSPPTENEKSTLLPQEIKDGYRLACQTYPLGDCKVYVPPESLTALQRTQVEGLDITVDLDPPVHSYEVELPSPSLSDLRADAERTLGMLYNQHRIKCSTIDIEALRTLSLQIRSSDWNIQASVRGDEVIAISPPSRHHLGLAFDIGTTKIAGYLLDLDNGKTLAAQGIMNPQITSGEDIITRLTYAMKSPSAAVRLQRVLIDALNKLILDLCAPIEAEPEEILEVVAVGNTAIHHLLLRLPVAQLATSPFLPAVSDAMDIKARDTGLRVAAGAYLHLLPNIAGFVGADHVAMLLSTGVWQADEVVLAIDIGTNTEVSMVSNGQIVCVSCASGPAFEGGHIKYGMRAAPGAIERLRLTDDRVEYQTIAGSPPTGLCGSGILDAMAQLYLAGVLNTRGRMGNHQRVRTNDGLREFVIVSEQERDGQPAITLTQSDIRELQLAKGAIRTGIQALLQSEGRDEKEIEKVVIAGAFGTYIDIASAITIGMLPPLPLDRFQQVGNAAGMGAKMALLSISKRLDAQKIAQLVEYIELTTIPDFNRIFMKAISIG